jgi:hypothetical protein
VRPFIKAINDNGKRTCHTPGTANYEGEEIDESAGQQRFRERGRGTAQPVEGRSDTGQLEGCLNVLANDLRRHDFRHPWGRLRAN